ncbi:autophagy-related protein 27 [Roridomyces roridus]|uniref:Autophagy-related protein 27 n=1 Tax=Roridomyces roridus TaxID=1738132 RepID=A0AAD7FWT3_9AGAR|nr:autophagy-related protein 27 [Roridomyces roridus]
MILRRDLPLFLILLSLSTLVLGDDDSFDCHVQLGGLKYDLSHLEHKTVKHDHPSPPTREELVIDISLCSDLKIEDSIPKDDQCPTGTRICLTKINWKGEDTRVTAVVPVAQTATLQPSYATLPSAKGLSVVLYGSAYPHPINSTETQQSANISILCNPDAPTDSSPTYTSYDGGRLELEWVSPAGCGFQGDSDNDKDESKSPGNSSSGALSSVGWFFLVLLLAFAAYMGLGAYYQYSTYGASGLDLIPHRDFWMEVPYMLKDVVSHLCSTVRPRRSSRGGYIAV